MYKTQRYFNRKASPELQAYIGMKQRCYNKKYASFHRYGGRGIIVCERWMESFDNFLEDMGNKPSSTHSIDRINSDGNYEPSNCRWATVKEQYGNTCRVKWVEFNGQRIRFTEICQQHGISTHNVDNRLRRGWSLEDALREPLKSKGNPKENRNVNNL